jgi:hypothetical protein
MVMIAKTAVYIATLAGHVEVRVRDQELWERLCCHEDSVRGMWEDGYGVVEFASTAGARRAAQEVG